MVSDSFGPVNVSNWELSKRPIAGRYPKRELTNNGEAYIIKFADYKQNKREVPYHVSEYISSRLINSLGYHVQKVDMATFQGNIGCLIKTYKEPLITFEGLGTSTLSGKNLLYDLDLLHSLFSEGKYAEDFEAYLWDTFCIDAFIANLDRHPNNWGFFKRKGIYHKAPLFDNASSLFSLNAFSVGKMADFENHIKKFSNSTIAYKGERQSFERIILSETSSVFAARLRIFKTRLSKLDLTSLGKVSKHWPQYNGYLDFVETFIERQVNWFGKV